MAGRILKRIKDCWEDTEKNKDCWKDTEEDKGLLEGYERG